MIKTKFFTKRSLLALGLSLWSVGTAEDVPNDGKYWYTAKPGHGVALEVVEQIKLKCITNLATDSVLWQVNGVANLVAGNPLVAKKDVAGLVYYKSNELWQVDSFAFNGITSYGDSVLVAPYFDNASYIWRFNGQVVANDRASIWIDSIGNYTVEILQNNAPHDTLKYGRTVINWLGTRYDPIYDSTLIGQDLNHFWIKDTNYQHWEWLQHNQYSYDPRFLMLEDGVVSLVAQKGGLWYRDLVTFYGIRKDGNLLRANVSAAKYQWYKDGNPVGINNSSVDLTVYGKGNYSLVATFITSTGEKTGTYFDFTGDDLGTYNNPITGYNWIKRSSDSLLISTPAGLGSYDLAFWKSQAVGGTEKLDSAKNVFILDGPTTVTLLVRSNGLWYQDMGFFAEDSTDLFGSFEKPYETELIKQDGFTLSVPAHMQGDTIIWFVYHQDTTVTKDSIYYGASIHLYDNARAVLMVKHNGSWFKDELEFTGIVLDPVSDKLQAPVIKNAQYEWFFNNKATGVFTSSFVPTEPGTYKVVMTWVESGQAAANERVAQEVKTAVFTFVVDAVTGVKDDQLLSGMALYPNPAQESFIFEGNMDAIEYRIEDLTGVSVKQGQVAAGVSVSVQDLQPGVYLVHTKVGHANMTKRLVVK